MIIVEQGKVVEFCAEPGEYKYDASTEPSLFAGSLGQSILNTFKTIGKRFTFGGDTAKGSACLLFQHQRIIGNKYGTPNPVPFRVVDKNIGLDIDIAIPLPRRVLLQDRRSPAVLYQCLRQRDRGAIAEQDRQYAQIRS